MIWLRWRRHKARSDSEFKHARRVLDSVYGVEAVFDEHLRLLWISASVERLSGVRAAQYEQAENVLELLVHDSDRELCRRRMEQVLADGVAQDFELRLRRHDGEVAWVRSHWRVLPADEAGPRLLRLSAEDIQGWKETESTLLETVTELRQAQGLREHYLMRSTHERQRLSALLDLIRLGIVFVDHDHRVLYSNRAMLEVWGLAAEVQLAGMYDHALLEMLAPLLEEQGDFFAHIAAVVERREALSEEREYRLADGRIITERSALVKGINQRRGIGRLWIYEDVTALRQATAQLQAMAERDPLTNVFNRRRFHHELERMLADAARQQSAVGLLSLDLDGFKPVNDVFGHQAGDEVLIAVVDRLGSVVRRNEMLFRIGGDEFAILTSDARPQALAEFSGRLCKELAALSFTFGGETSRITVSIGIAVYPDDADDGSSLITAADQAMYRSKSKGRNCWTLFGRNGES